MFLMRWRGIKPDIHHIRTFGALAYVHIPVTSSKHKQQSNARIGFVLGYAEDVVSGKVYFPEVCNCPESGRICSLS